MTDFRIENPNAGGVDIGDSVVGGTSGSVLFVDSSGNLAQDNTNFRWDDTNDNLTIGTSAVTTSRKLNVQSTVASPATSQFTETVGLTITGSTAAISSAQNISLTANPGSGESVSATFISAQSNQTTVSGSGTITQLNNIDARMFAISSSTNLTKGIAFYVRTPFFFSYTGTVTDMYGLYIQAQNRAGITNGWGVYQEDATDKNYFNGKTGIGTNSPGGRFQVTSATAAEIPSIIKGAASQSANLTEWQNSSGTPLTYIEPDGEFIIDQDSKALKLGADQDATILYDGTNLVMNPKAVGSGVVAISGDATVDDEAYGSGWNGSLEVPTKNAVYDQVELKAPLASPSFTGLVTATGTLGSEVVRIQSTATNDDPAEKVYQNRVTTTDATQTTIHTFTIPASTTFGIDFTIVARRTGGTAGTAEDGGMWQKSEVFKNDAGTATSIGNVRDNGTSSTGTWSTTFTPDSNTVKIDVTGDADTNVVWHMTARTWQVST